MSNNRKLVTEAKKAIAAAKLKSAKPWQAAMIMAQISEDSEEGEEADKK